MAGWASCSYPDSKQLAAEMPAVATVRCVTAPASLALPPKGISALLPLRGCSLRWGRTNPVPAQTDVGGAVATCHEPANRSAGCARSFLGGGQC